MDALHVAERPVPDNVQVTLLTFTWPIGVLLVPVSESVTVAVQLRSMLTVAEGQETWVVVVRGWTITVKAALGPFAA